MSDAEIEKQFSPADFTVDDFHSSFREFDKAACEALTVSQKTGVRFAQAYKGWSTHIFLRMCIHSQIMIANIPESRWSGNNYDFWDFSLVAPYTRDLLKAELLFMYISEEPECEAEWSAKLNIMHMNDCVKN
ncbi:hypothetical protein [Erwinia amylovora]|uniref:hypothetical protein n=1 Tax=Erwinia amylovora TaxID=552 RepID=UPI0006875399|nr:hypothetical protein [Erwinia amylovora]